MSSFQVIEMNEGIERAVRSGLSRWKNLQADAAQEHPALVAISPDAAAYGRTLPNSCRTVLLPGGAGELLQELQAASVVRYGGSARDSLTLSSCQPERISVALQRDLVTVEGQVLERQEFPLRRPAGMGTWQTLAAVGTLLLLGVPPEELMEQGSIHLSSHDPARHSYFLA